MDGTSLRSDNRSNAWAGLPQLEMPQKATLRAAIADEHNPERCKSYDMLRTRMLHELSEHRWTRIGVSQSMPGTASSLTALNLALSEARRPERRVALIDLDLAHQPILARLGQTPALTTGPTFRTRKISAQLACVSVAAPLQAAATMLLCPQFQADLADQIAELDPDLTILHMPPLLDNDAGLASLPLVQTVLLVIDGRRDTAADLRRCEAYVTRHCPVLGLFLHNAEA